MGLKLLKNYQNTLILPAVLLLLLPTATKQASVQLFVGSRDLNQITLRCRFNNGIRVNNAKFYRNGLEYSLLNGTCLQTIATYPPSNSQLAIELTAECEGYFQCSHQPALPGSLPVLSAPLTLYAYPNPLTSVVSLTIEVPLGDNVQLPCPFEVSALNSFRITWQKTKNSAQTILNNPLNDDYSIVLPNITFEDAGIYFCTVVSIPFETIQIARHNGPIITLKVIQRHVPPVFTSDLSFRKDVDLNYLFQIQAKGTDPLMFQWYIEGIMVTPRNFVIQPTDTNQVLEKRSELQVDLSEIAEGKSSLNLTVFVMNENSDEEVFSIGQTSIIFIFREDDYSPADSLEDKTDMDFKETLLYVVGFALLLSWILIFLLVIAIVYFKLQLKLLQRRQWRESVTELPLHNRECPSENSSSNMEIAAPTPDSSIMIQDSDKWSNPISYILYHVAIKYRNESPSSRSLIQSFHQILIEVLNTLNVTKDHEVMDWVIDMRDRVREFGDKLLREEWAKRRQQSRGLLENTSKQNRHSNPIPSGDQDTASILTASEDIDSEDVPAADETDEMCLQAAKEVGSVRDMTHIQKLLDEWIARHQQNNSDPHTSN